MSKHAVYFEVVSLTLSDLGTLPDIKRLFVLQVIANLRLVLTKLLK